MLQLEQAALMEWLIIRAILLSFYRSASSGESLGDTAHSRVFLISSKVKTAWLHFRLVFDGYSSWVLRMY